MSISAWGVDHGFDEISKADHYGPKHPAMRPAVFNSRKQNVGYGALGGAVGGAAGTVLGMHGIRPSNYRGAGGAVIAGTAVGGALLGGPMGAALGAASPHNKIPHARKAQRAIEDYHAAGKRKDRAARHKALNRYQDALYD